MDNVFKKFRKQQKNVCVVTFLYILVSFSNQHSKTEWNQSPKPVNNTSEESGNNKGYKTRLSEDVTYKTDEWEKQELPHVFQNDFKKGTNKDND